MGRRRSWLHGRLELFVRSLFGLAEALPTVFANTSLSFYEALLVPFEISAFTLVLSFWSPTLTEPGPVAGICVGVILIYG